MTAAKILVAPLDWGMGHATRMVPVIDTLCTRGYDVWLAANGSAASFLKDRYPNLPLLSPPAYDIRYADKRMFYQLMKQIPETLKVVKQEHQWLEKQVEAHQFQAVISDNRFGMWSAKVPSVFVTHQLNILSPVFKGVATGMNKQFIGKFTACWVPDGANNELSGELSRGELAVPHHYLGPLSRFRNLMGEHTEKTYDVLAVVSGPEPTRSTFEKQLVDQLSNTHLKWKLLRGKPVDDTPETDQILNHANDATFADLVKGAKLVVCRSGYSTLMDLIQFNTPLLCIPTPGQPEQEYLAQHWEKQGWCMAHNQNAMDISKALDQLALSLPAFPQIASGLDNELDRLLATI